MKRTGIVIAALLTAALVGMTARIAYAKYEEQRNEMDSLDLEIENLRGTTQQTDAELLQRKAELEQQNKALLERLNQAEERLKKVEERPAQIIRTRLIAKATPVRAPSGRVQTAPVYEGDVPAAIRAKFGNERWVRIAKCESGFRPNAVNGPHRGLFQINVRLHAKRIAGLGYTAGQMFEVGPNIEVAYALSSGGTNFRPWSCKG